MTPADEARFIEVWTQGLSYREIAQALGCALGTLASRASALVAQGKIRPRPRGGAYPKQRGLARQDGEPSPALPAAERKDIQQWTVRLSKALIEHLKALAYEQRIPPSQLVEELLWKALRRA
jgi:transposase